MTIDIVISGVFRGCKNLGPFSTVLIYIYIYACARARARVTLVSFNMHGVMWFMCIQSSVVCVTTVLRILRSLQRNMCL